MEVFSLEETENSGSSSNTSTPLSPMQISQSTQLANMSNSSNSPFPQGENFGNQPNLGVHLHNFSEENYNDMNNLNISSLLENQEAQSRQLLNSQRRLDMRNQQLEDMRGQSFAANQNFGNQLTEPLEMIWQNSSGRIIQGVPRADQREVKHKLIDKTGSNKKYKVNDWEFVNQLHEHRRKYGENKLGFGDSLKDKRKEKTAKEKQRRVHLRNLYQDLSKLINLDNVGLISSAIDYIKGTRRKFCEWNRERQMLLQTIRRLKWKMENKSNQNSNQSPIIINMNCGDKPAPFYYVQGEGAIQNQHQHQHIQNNINQNINNSKITQNVNNISIPTAKSPEPQHNTTETRKESPQTTPTTEPQLSITSSDTNTLAENSQTTNASQLKSNQTKRKFKVDNEEIKETPALLGFLLNYSLFKRKHRERRTTSGEFNQTNPGVCGEENGGRWCKVDRQCTINHK